MYRSYSRRLRLVALGSALLACGGSSEAPERGAQSAAVPAISAPALTESEAATLSSAGVGVVDLDRGEAAMAPVVVRARLAAATESLERGGRS